MVDLALEGTLDGVKFRLAPWAEEPYVRRHIPVDPETGVVGGDDSRFSIVPGTQLWHIAKWAAGEDPDSLWDDTKGTYDVSAGAKPVKVGEGIELAFASEVTDDSGASTFNDGGRFGYGLGKVFTIKDGDAYYWDLASGEWSAGTVVGAGANLATSLSSDGGTYMFSAHDNLSMRRFIPGGANAMWYDTSGADDFVNDPVIRSWGGVLYALDGDDLYEISQAAANTRTLLADLVGSSAVYLAAAPWCYNRMSASDTGPIWLQVLDNGQTFVWEYNVANDTSKRIGKLPVDFAFPYSIAYTTGFIFVGFRYASAHAQSGDAYLYYQRGAQRGLAGPFRSISGNTASKPVLIAGQIGSELIVYFDGGVWAYDLSTGGISLVGEQSTTGTPQDAITFGKEIFIGNVTSGGNTDAVEKFDSEAYTTSGTIDTGRYDMRYLGLPKILLEVTVATDPLPASTSVSMSYSVDGGSFTALSGSHSVDGASVYTWTVSTSTTTVAGREFAFRATLAGTASATPTIRTITATATGGAHVREWILKVDCSTNKSGSEASHVTVDWLNALVTAEDVVAFLDPYQNRQIDAADSFDVTVEEVFTPRESAAEPEFALVRLRGTALVT